MNLKKEVTMTWDEAPDTITPDIYAKIRGHSPQWARDRFNDKNFPKIESGKQIADKTAVMLYDIGINIKTQTKQGIEFLMLLELQKLNKRLENQKLESEVHK